MSEIFESIIFQGAHFLDIHDLNRNSLKTLLNLAACNLPLDQSFSAQRERFSGKTQINLFFENSTRTQASFELAGKKLGLDVINLSVQNSSVKKGETLLDTIRTLHAMQPDLLVVRHSSSQALSFLAKNVDACVINAGEGTHAHPTQALLDALTIQNVKGRIEGLVIVICGDILHSRVARSDIIGLHMLGAQLRVVGPTTLLPHGLEEMGVEIFYDMDEALENADVVIMLRLQNERMSGAFIPSIAEYNHFYGLTRERLSYAKRDCIVMHPGPMNRGVEIMSDVVESKQTVIEKQVELGVAVRMAVIESLLDSKYKA